MSPPRAQYDLDSGLVRPAQCVTVLWRKFYFGIQQRAIEINGDEADRALHTFILPSGAALSVMARRIVCLSGFMVTPQNPNRDKRKKRFAPAPPTNVKYQDNGAAQGSHHPLMGHHRR